MHHQGDHSQNFPPAVPFIKCFQHIAANCHIQLSAGILFLQHADGIIGIAAARAVHFPLAHLQNPERNLIAVHGGANIAFFAAAYDNLSGTTSPRAGYYAGVTDHIRLHRLHGGPQVVHVPGVGRVKCAAK